MQKTLAIALCDTNFADRKQMERLLERESDKRINSCVFYMDTYGNQDALLNNPRVYDAYFLDMPNESYSAYDLAKDIRLRDIYSPIIFCNSTMNYQNCGKELPNTYFINKPILVADLSNILDELIKQKEENYVPTVEIRNTKDVFYLTEKEIVYCQNRGRSSIIKLYLQDGTIMETENFIDNFLTELKPLGNFFMANNNTIINARYVSKVGLFRISLQNKKSISIQGSRRLEIRNAMKNL